jgi:hypothetical protein
MSTVRPDPLPFWLAPHLRDWVSAHRDELECIYDAFDRTGDWPSPGRLQRALAADGYRINIVRAADGIPRQLGFREQQPDQVVLTLFSLACLPSAKLLLEHYFKCVQLAMSAYKSETEQARLRRADVIRKVGLSELEARKLSRVVLRDAPFLGVGRSEVDDWDREVSDYVFELVDLRDADDLVARLAIERGINRLLPVARMRDAEAQAHLETGAARDPAIVDRATPDPPPGQGRRLVRWTADHVGRVIVGALGGLLAALLIVHFGVGGGISESPPSSPPEARIKTRGEPREGVADPERRVAYEHAVQTERPAFWLRFRARSADALLLHDGAVVASGGLFGRTDGSLSLHTGSSALLPAVSQFVGERPRTVVVWVQTRDPRQQVLFDMGEARTDARFLLALVDAKTPEFAPRREQGVYLAFWDDDVYLPGLDLADGRWHGIAVTLSRRVARVFVDGTQPHALLWNGVGYGPEQKPPFRLPGLPDTPESPLTIGRPGPDAGNWTGGLEGRIDEVAVFDHALPVSRVRPLFSSVGLP